MVEDRAPRWRGCTFSLGVPDDIASCVNATPLPAWEGVTDTRRSYRGPSTDQTAMAGARGSTVQIWPSPPPQGGSGGDASSWFLPKFPSG